VPIPPGHPQHPLPAALLTTMRRHARPVGLYLLRWDTEHKRLRDAFLRAEDAKVPRWSARTKDALDPLAVLTAVLLALWFAVQAVMLRAEFTKGDVGQFVGALFVCLVVWVMLAVPMAWPVLRWWPARRDPFREFCRRLPPHSAEQALDPLQAERLRQSAQDPLLRAQAEETWVDSGGAF
jgi:hypothetical protein